jgi:hypothetical protein
MGVILDFESLLAFTVCGPRAPCPPEMTRRGGRGVGAPRSWIATSPVGNSAPPVHP